MNDKPVKKTVSVAVSEDVARNMKIRAVSQGRTVQDVCESLFRGYAAGYEPPKVSQAA